MASKLWYERMLAVDRRWIYLVMGLAVILSVIRERTVPVSVSTEVRSVHSFVEALEPGDVLFVAIDYDPSTLAELHPMAQAILGQAFDRGARIVLTALSQFGPSMAQELIEEVAAAHGKQRGIDYTFLGYKPYPEITILAMGTDFRVPFPTDYFGTPIADIPMMQDVHNFDDVKAVISLAGGNVADMWLRAANAKYGVKLALGVTGVMAADYYPYLQSGQLFGLIPGVKGAAEYERLEEKPGAGTRGMPPQVASHLVILVFIVATNVAYVAQRRAQSRARRG